jgi:hypothetical protein
MNPDPNIESLLTNKQHLVNALSAIIARYQPNEKDTRSLVSAVNSWVNYHVSGRLLAPDMPIDVLRVIATIFSNHKFYEESHALDYLPLRCGDKSCGWTHEYDGAKPLYLWRDVQCPYCGKPLLTIRLWYSLLKSTRKLHGIVVAFKKWRHPEREYYVDYDTESSWVAYTKVGT